MPRTFTYLEQLERGILTEFRETLWQPFCRSVKRYRLIQPGDRIAVCISGGQQQRVAIARGLVSNPEIIYFDEPTSALDPELIGEVLAVMRQLAEEGMTMLVVTHEMDFARHVSNKVLFMTDGNVVESGPSKEFFEHPQQERSREFIKSILEARK